MTSCNAATILVQALEAAGIPYMVVGSLSSNVYGVARSTQDADFVVELRGDGLAKLESQLGPAFSLNPQMEFETQTGTVRHTIRAAGSAFLLELFQLSDDLHDRLRFSRRIRLRLDDLGCDAFVATAEDVIITKLRWARGKDREDVRDVIAVQGDLLDWSYIHHWCDLHGTRALLDEIRRSIPPLDEPLS